MSAPKTTLAEIIKKSRSNSRTVEMELALQDFLELPHNEQVELLFVELVQVQAQSHWLMRAFESLFR